MQTILTLLAQSMNLKTLLNIRLVSKDWKDFVLFFLSNFSKLYLNDSRPEKSLRFRGKIVGLSIINKNNAAIYLCNSRETVQVFVVKRSIVQLLKQCIDVILHQEVDIVGTVGRHNFSESDQKKIKEICTESVSLINDRRIYFIGIFPSLDYFLPPITKSTIISLSKPDCLKFHSEALLSDNFEKCYNCGLTPVIRSHLIPLSVLERFNIQAGLYVGTDGIQSFNSPKNDVFVDLLFCAACDGGRLNHHETIFREKWLDPFLYQDATNLSPAPMYYFCVSLALRFWIAQRGKAFEWNDQYIEMVYYHLNRLIFSFDDVSQDAQELDKSCQFYFYWAEGILDDLGESLAFRFTIFPKFKFFGSTLITTFHVGNFIFVFSLGPPLSIYFDSDFVRVTMDSYFLANKRIDSIPRNTKHTQFMRMIAKSLPKVKAQVLTSKEQKMAIARFEKMERREKKDWSQNLENLRKELSILGDEFFIDSFVKVDYLRGNSSCVLYLHPSSQMIFAYLTLLQVKEEKVKKISSMTYHNCVLGIESQSNFYVIREKIEIEEPIVFPPPQFRNEILKEITNLNLNLENARLLSFVKFLKNFDCFAFKYLLDGSFSKLV